jgi:heat shock protein HslJ
MPSPASLGVLISVTLLADGSFPQGARVKPTLENTHWALTRVAKDRVGTMRREPHLVLESKNSRASGFAGCNQFTARYQLSGRRLAFSRISYTRMACLDPRESRIEKAFLSALEHVRTWRIDGSTLQLLDARGAFLVQFSTNHVQKER